LKRSQEALQSKCGLSIKTGVELEFHLVSAADASRLADAADTAAKPCYQVEPLMRQYDLIAELLQYMEELGWEPYQADHEDSCGQFELNWTYDDALITADRQAFFKWMTREAAARRGMVCDVTCKACCACLPLQASLSGRDLAHFHAIMADDQPDRATMQRRYELTPARTRVPSPAFARVRARPLPRAHTAGRNVHAQALYAPDGQLCPHAPLTV